jgi:hypothetical protein
LGQTGGIDNHRIPPQGCKYAARLA